MESRKRRCLLISEKVEIIIEIDRRVKNVDVCKKLGCHLQQSQRYKRINLSKVRPSKQNKCKEN